MGHYPVSILISLHSTLVLNTQHKMMGITTDLNLSEQTPFNQSVSRGASRQSSLSIIKFCYSTLALYIIYKYRTENLKTLSLTMLSSERDLTHVTHVTLSILTVFNNRWGGGGWWPIFYQIYHSNSCQLTLLFSPSPTLSNDNEHYSIFNNVEGNRDSRKYVFNKRGFFHVCDHYLIAGLRGFK